LKEFASRSQSAYTAQVQANTATLSRYASLEQQCQSLIQQNNELLRQISAGVENYRDLEEDMQV